MTNPIPAHVEAMMKALTREQRRNIYQIVQPQDIFCSASDDYVDTHVMMVAWRIAEQQEKAQAAGIERIGAQGDVYTMFMTAARQYVDETKLLLNAGRINAER